MASLLNRTKKANKVAGSRLKPRGKFYKNAAIRRRIVELLAFGHTHADIAETLGCSLSMIGNTARVFREDLQRFSKATIEESRKSSEGVLNWVKQRAQEAYLRSTEKLEEVRTAETPDGGVQKTKTTRNRDGSSEHLNVILAAEKRRADLLGLDQPKEVKHYLMERQETLEAIFAACEAVGMSEQQMDKFIEALQARSKANIGTADATDSPAT